MTPNLPSDALCQVWPQTGGCGSLRRCPATLCSACVQGLLRSALGSTDNTEVAPGRSSAASARSSCRWSAGGGSLLGHRHIPGNDRGDQRSQPSVETTNLRVEADVTRQGSPSAAASRVVCPRSGWNRFPVTQTPSVSHWAAARAGRHGCPPVWGLKGGQGTGERSVQVCLRCSYASSCCPK